MDREINAILGPGPSKGTSTSAAPKGSGSGAKSTSPTRKKEEEHRPTKEETRDRSEEFDRKWESFVDEEESDSRLSRQSRNGEVTLGSSVEEVGRSRSEEEPSYSEDELEVSMPPPRRNSGRVKKSG
jgi:hypothetical protein